MSSRERRAELDAEWQVECAARMSEELRKGHLSMYERINEATTSDDVKDILHRMAEHMGAGIMADFRLMRADERPQRGGWAPGPYMDKCHDCGEIFIGDKRAIICAPCAYKEPPE